MTKIPIEIVLQDPDNPIVPDTPGGDSGDNTNISVPNTAIGAGYTTKDSNVINNIFGGSNATVSIVSIVVLVLTLGVIATILVRKYQKHKKGIIAHTSRKERLTTIASSTLAILATAVLVGNLVIPATNAATSVEPGTAELETADKITITATREADSDSDTITATVKNTSYATANLDFGYKVTASMAEGLTNANLYLDGDETSEYYISPVADGTLADNTWGYTLEQPTEESSYLSIPLSTKPTNIVKEVAKTAEDKPVDIYYTVQIDKDMPNGTYTGELEYTLSPAIEYMQDFSTLTSAEKTATLTNMPEGKQYILKDSRDNKSYYISKLADENVWMTQNLDLNLGSTLEPLTSKNTNLTVAGTGIYADEHYVVDETGMITWTPDNNTIATNLETNWQDSNTAPYSYDPGDVYYYTTGDDNPEEAIDKETCEEAHPDGSCAHYHAGNYYNWSAAIASNNSTALGPNEGDQYKNAANSICPAGWRLPDGPSAENTSYNDMANMLTGYDGLLGGWQSGPPGGYYDYLEGGFNKIRTNPLWLVRSGYAGGGSLISGGDDGCYWSNTVSNSTDAYYLYIGDDFVSPAQYRARHGGYSVRCLAQ